VPVDIPVAAPERQECGRKRDPEEAARAHALLYTVVDRGVPRRAAAQDPIHEVAHDTRMAVERSDLPRGTVTFVFTDIAGSTRLLRELGADGYARELAEHRDLVRVTFARHDGTEVDSQGDAFFFAFRTPQQALEAASEGLAASTGGRVRVRIGVHTGTPLLTSEGYVGTDVHRASRIANAGHGGQILVSATTATLVEADGFELLDLGKHRLKDLGRPERLFQLGSGAFPPIRSLSPSNLPAPTTAFLGRQAELERLKQILASGSARVVTLTGPGGIGKTRLAVQAARESSDRFLDGRWWVPLGPLSDPRLVHSALASALTSEEPREALTSDPIARLGTGSSLVLLDCAEHLLPTLAEELAPVIGAAGGATFLVTSRAPLHLESEFVYPLPVMNPEDATSFFLSRAHAAGIDLESSAAQSRLCERLDHLPLAMQLVAAQLKVFTLEQLTDRLSNLLDVQGQRDAEPRHRTLRAAIEWSHSLLSPEQQQAFRRISIFPAGATVEALEEITETDLDTLFALLDASLLRRRDETNEPRFWMLETIREFARERLEEAGEVQEIRARHAGWYRALASRAGRALDGGSEDWLGVLDAEIENIRATLSWFLEEEDFEAAQDVAGSVGRYWVERGSLGELRSWLDRSLSGGPRYGAAFAVAINRLSSAVYLQGDYELARTTAEEALTAARDVGDPIGIQYALTNLANALEAMDLLDEAWPMEEEVLRICRALRGEHPRLLTLALINISYSALIRGWYEDAVAYSEEAISVTREHGDSWSAGVARCNLAEASLHLGRVDLAAEQVMDAISIGVDVSDRLLQADCLEVLAAVQAERGTHRSAARILGTSEALRDLIGYPMQPAEKALRQDTLAKIRVEIGESELTSAWSEGAGSDVEETLAVLGGSEA
jgi:predicted ATPase/class 3 adenylate cyclase